MEISPTLMGAVAAFLVENFNGFIDVQTHKDPSEEKFDWDHIKELLISRVLVHGIIFMFLFLNGMFNPESAIGLAGKKEILGYLAMVTICSYEVLERERDLVLDKLFSKQDD